MNNGDQSALTAVSVALLRYSDTSARQLAFKVLDEAGIAFTFQSGMNILELSVAEGQAQEASAALTREPGLDGKLLSCDELRRLRNSA